MRQLAIIVLAVFASFTFAADNDLVVNGVHIAGSTSDLLPGVSYAPVNTLAEQLGAAVLPDQSGNTLRLLAAGRFLELPFGEPGASAEATMRYDGAVRSGHPALHIDGVTYVPVKAVAEAFGGSVTFVSEHKRVVVTQPRPRLSTMTRQDDPSERLVLRLSAPARYDLTFVDSRTIELSFPRVDTELFIPPVRGTLFTEARIEHRGENVVVRMIIQDGVDARAVELPHAGRRGFDLLVVFVSAESGDGMYDDATIVLDPAGGGAETGQVFSGYGTESELAYQLAERLQQELATHGIGASLTRPENGAPGVIERSLLGLGSDVFLSLHAADLAVGEFNVYYLGDAQNIATLDYTIRLNNTAGDNDSERLRRDILLNYQVELATGRTIAETFAQRLANLGGYRVTGVQAAPLQVLGGAAGRGVFLEFSPADLAAPELARHVTQVVIELLDRFGRSE